MELLTLGIAYTLSKPINKDIKAYLDKLPVKCPYIISSGYRTKKKNTEVGGVKNSLHLHNRAVDLVVKGKERVFCRSLILKSANTSNLTVIKYSTHIHLDNRKKPKCLVAIKKHIYRYCTKKDLD